MRVFLNERQYLPAESRRRIGKWSRGLERIFEDVIQEGMRSGEFRSDLDTRLATLAMLGMANAVAAWYGKEERRSSASPTSSSRCSLGGLAPAPEAPAIGMTACPIFD